MSRTKYLYNALPRRERPERRARHARARQRKSPSSPSSTRCRDQQSPVFRHYALELAGKPRQLNLLMVSDGATFWDKLALYRLTGDKARLAKARTLADAYIKARINTPQRDFSDVHLDAGGQFWSDFAPKFVELFELWQETKEPRYLAAAQKGARSYASFAWYFPRVPQGEVTVDRGGVAPVGLFTAKPDAQGIRTPEVTLPAWQVSQIGLTPEAQTTYHLESGHVPRASRSVRAAHRRGRERLLPSRRRRVPQSSGVTRRSPATTSTSRSRTSMPAAITTTGRSRISTTTRSTTTTSGRTSRC